MKSDLIRVVLTDDHKLVRTGIRNFLESSKQIQVIGEAKDGAEAIGLVDQTHPDVLILDIQMPVLNGIETTKLLRQQGSQVGILILTAYDDPPYVKALLQAGVNGYVLKTAEPEEIIAAIKDVYAGKTVVDEMVYQTEQNRLEPSDWTLGAEQKALSEREIEVLSAAASGLTNKAIAALLNISGRTVQNHLAKIFNKLNADSRTEAVLMGIKLGYISIKDDQRDILTNGSIHG